MSARFEGYREDPKGSDIMAQGAADWLQAVIEISAERQKQRLEQATPVEVQVVDVNKTDDVA